jgi:hypothetical protein
MTSLVLKKFGVPLQMAIMTRFKYYSKEGFKFEFELKPRYIVDYTVEVL